MEIKKMNFTYTDNITAVNQKQYEEHLKLYEGYVTKINQIDEQLKLDPDTKNANATYSKYRCLKRGESFALDGVILHELYFENMGGIDLQPSQVAKDMIKDSFGSYEQWMEDFIACGIASRGWAILAYDQRSRTLRNESLDAHDVGFISLSFPLLVMDVYEHAYFLQYGTNRKEYINQFMKNINWNIVNRRVDRI